MSMELLVPYELGYTWYHEHMSTMIYSISFLSVQFCKATIWGSEIISGLSGRGLLEKFGPNHVALPIITRNAKDDDGSSVIVAEKQVLEVLLDCSQGETRYLPEIKGVYNDLLPKEVVPGFT